MVLKGFKLGMMLQLAIGPICLMVFRTAGISGFLMGFLLALAVAIVDACFITLAGAGIGAVINKDNVKKIFKAVGCAVLILFGINTIAGALGCSLLPVLSLYSNTDGMNIFLQGLILTASSPMTILFWSGIFSAQVIMHRLTRKQLVFFGMGCVLSTLVFLDAVAVLGSAIKGVIPQAVMMWLNIGVGAMLVFWGIRLPLSKKDYGINSGKEPGPDNGEKEQV